jgi:hypothetical protein
MIVHASAGVSPLGVVLGVVIAGAFSVVTYLLSSKAEKARFEATRNDAVGVPWCVRKRQGASR